MKLNSFIITRNAQLPLDPFCSPWLLLRRKQFSLFKKLLAAIICGLLRTKDRSESVEVTAVGGALRYDTKSGGALGYSKLAPRSKKNFP